MARVRTATERVLKLSHPAVERALKASLEAGTQRQFYALVEMRNPSRSYFLRSEGRLHSLKAVATFALREETPNSFARDFHAADAAKRMRELKFEVVHDDSGAASERERRWINSLKRPGQAAFRSSLFDIYSSCPLSGCTTPFALEAAHVSPFAGGGSDETDNGILLRADLHKLFDANLIAINPTDGTIWCAPQCRADYAKLLTKATFVTPNGGPPLLSFAARWEVRKVE